MLASIFSKVTVSLGKSFVFTGLLPAGVLLAFVATYLTTIATLLGAAQSALTEPESWKSFALLGAAWIGLGFILYAARVPFLSFFQRIPTGRIGRALLFRHIRQRELAFRKRDEILWRATSIVWLTKLNLDRAQIGDIPHWISRSAKEVALERSERGRTTLMAVDRSVGDVLNLRAPASNRIVDGLFSLYCLAQRKGDASTERSIKTEIERWQFSYSSPEARQILRHVDQDLERQYARAFSDCGRFGEGPYVFPTELGNQISALDDYALRRYGIDTAPFWDRVWWVLPKDAKLELNDARLALEALVNLTFVFLFCAGALPLLEVAKYLNGIDAVSLYRVITFLIFLGAGLILAALTYRGAAFAMEVISIKTKSLIDMYRLPVLEQLGFKVGTVREERELYARLKEFFVQGEQLPCELKLTMPKKSESKSDKEDPSSEKAKDEDSGEQADSDDLERGSDATDEAPHSKPTSPDLAAVRA